MPVAVIHLVAGRAPEKKRAMILAVSQAIASTLGAPTETVRVIVQETPEDLWGAGDQTIAERRARRAGEQQ